MELILHAKLSRQRYKMIPIRACRIHSFIIQKPFVTWFDQVPAFDLNIKILNETV